MTAAALAVSPAAAIGDSDGSTTSVQGNGGTDVTGAIGHSGPSHHVLDNTGLCLPALHHIQVGVPAPVQAVVPVADQQSHQTCLTGQATRGLGDGDVSHLGLTPAQPGPAQPTSLEKQD